VPASSAPSGDAASFALGNVSFVVFHEVGHALISEYELPVLGREEDAVDNFASVILAPDQDDPPEDAAILTDAIAGWFASAERTGLEEIAWWDVHGPDRQRAYQIGCLLYGSKAGAYDELAETIELPAERRDGCAAEYMATERSWTSLLAPHLLADGLAPPARVTVDYGPPGAYGTERRLLQESELLEGVAEGVTTTFSLKRPLTIRARACGEPNAYWDPEAAEITVCYELVRDYLELHAQLGGQAVSDASE